MHRNIKSGIYSNNSIRFNNVCNNKTKNITYIENEELNTKINCNNLKENKKFNRKNKIYKLNNDEYFF